jgi:hypothetical protein
MRSGLEGVEGRGRVRNGGRKQETWQRLADVAAMRKSIGLGQSDGSGSEPQQDYESASTIIRLLCCRHNLAGEISAHAKTDDENVMLCKWLKLGLPKTRTLR